MKPVTEDVVYSILQGLEKREARKRRKMEAAKAALPAKVLGPVGNGRIIVLDRAKSRAQKTVTGFYCYMASRVSEVR